MDKKMSYIYGLFQTDGNLYEQSRNRGRLTLEFNSRDLDILKKIDNIIPQNSYITSRKRTTNFGKIKTTTLSIYDLDFRNMFKSFGFPAGNKSNIIKPPENTKYFECDYIRGLIDGDGSLGFTSKGFPFISFITKSECIKNYFINFVYLITNKKKEINKNKRDNAYNIVVYKEDAIKIIKKLYYKNCLSIKRKYNLALKIINWKRPIDMKIINQKKWNKVDDEFILTHTIDESMKKLNRTDKSIKMRIWRLNNVK